MLRSLIIITFCWYCFSAIAQRDFTLYGEVFSEHKINYIDNDTISFLQCTSSYSSVKPTMIYLTGSLPKPLIIEFEDGVQMMPPFHYFDIKELLNNYNLIVVSRPFTPVHSYEKDLINFLYIPDKNNPNCLGLDYLRCDNLDYLGERTDFLIDRLKESGVIPEDRIILMGHSQGGREAARVAKLNKHVSDVVILSCGAYGRMQHVLVDMMRAVLKDEMSFDDYFAQKSAAFEYLKLAIENPEDFSCERGAHKNVLSFATHMVHDILETDAAIYYATGMHDIAALHADQLMVDCWLANKTNIATKVFPNSEHSFIHVDPDGSLNYELMYWDELMTDVLNWLQR